MTRFSRPSRTVACALAALAVLTGAFGTRPTPPAHGATPAEVDKAIDKAREFLYSQMDPQFHNWEKVQKPDPKAGGADVLGKQWGGISSIAVYALLASGENRAGQAAGPRDRLHQGRADRRQLRAGPPLADLALRAAEGGRPAGAARRAALLRAVYDDPKKDKEKLGFYAYWTGPKGPADNWYDLSVSQYGVLGMWACEQAGYEVPLSYWQLVDGAWKNMQTKGALAGPAANPAAGAWPYRKDDKRGVEATMTAAGIATLFITQDYLLQQNAWSQCKGGVPNLNIDAGLAWMDVHINELLGGNYYGMYGVERIGVASGRKYFGTVDWYHGRRRVTSCKPPGPDGSWGDVVPNTCFAMLFLVRGRAPVIMNKLEYAPERPAVQGRRPAVERAPARRRQLRPLGRQAVREVPQLADRQPEGLARRPARRPDPLHQRQRRRWTSTTRSATSCASSSRTAA